MDAHNRLYCGYEMWMLITGYTGDMRYTDVHTRLYWGYEVWMLIPGYTGDMRYGCSYQVIQGI